MTVFTLCECVCACRFPYLVLLLFLLVLFFQISLAFPSVVYKINFAVSVKICSMLKENRTITNLIRNNMRLLIL